MASNLLVFIRELLGHWLALVFGPVVSLIQVILDKKYHKEIKWKHVVALFLIGVPIAMFLAWQDEYTSAEWRGSEVVRLNANDQAKRSQIENLQSILEQKERPIIVQAAPDLAAEEILKRQDEQMRELKAHMPSPKKRAEQLSKDMLTFLSDRMKLEPTFSPPINATRDQWTKAMNDNDQAYVAWMGETAREYQLEFSVPVTSILQDAQAAGINTTGIQMCMFANGNTFGIQECGARIGALAEKLPQ